MEGPTPGGRGGRVSTISGAAGAGGGRAKAGEVAGAPTGGTATSGDGTAAASGSEDATGWAVTSCTVSCCSGCGTGAGDSGAGAAASGSGGGAGLIASGEGGCTSGEGAGAGCRVGDVSTCKVWQRAEGSTQQVTVQPPELSGRRHACRQPSVVLCKEWLCSLTLQAEYAKPERVQGGCKCR